MDPPLTLDRIIELQPRRTGRAIRNVPSTLTLFDSHFPRFPVLPGVIVLQALADLACLVMEGDEGLRWRLAGAGRLKFRSYVTLGDQMELSVDVVEHSVAGATLRGRVHVDDRLVTAVGRLRLVPEDT